MVKIARVILTLSVFFAMSSILLFCVIILIPDIKDLFVYDISLGGASIFERPWLFLGTVMYETYELGGLHIPRVKSFANEASALLAYFYFPLAFSLLFWKKKSFVIIFLFLCLSFSGTVYILLPIIFYIYLIFLLSKKINIILYPYFLLLTIIISLIAIYISFVPYQIYDKEFDPSMLYVPDTELFSIDFLFKRSWSALIRLSSISSAADVFFSSPIVGSSYYVDIPFGYVMYSSFISGIFGLSIALIVYKKINEIIAKKMLTTNSVTEFYAMLVFTGYFFIAFLFNNYSFTTPYGMIIFALAIRLIFIKEKECVELLG